MGGVRFVSRDRCVVYADSIPEWLERGMSIREIAEGFGVTPQTIHYQLRKLGYTYSRTQGWRKPE